MKASSKFQPGLVQTGSWLPGSNGEKRERSTLHHHDLVPLFNLIMYSLPLQSHLQTPWAEANNAELATGSLFSARVLVKPIGMRLLLKQFVGQPKSPAAGLDSEQYADLLSHFADAGHPLQHYLVGHMCILVGRKQLQLGMHQTNCPEGAASLPAQAGLRNAASMPALAGGC